MGDYKFSIGNVVQVKKGIGFVKDLVHKPTKVLDISDSKYTGGEPGIWYQVELLEQEIWFKESELELVSTKIEME